MFAKHSFGVKYPPDIPCTDPAPAAPSAGPESDVTPREQNQIMTAAFEANPHSIAHERLAPEIYRARRLSALALVFGLVVGAVLGVVSVGNQAAASRGDRSGEADSLVLTVMPGDTLWGIAKSLVPDADPRALVHELSAIAGKGPLQPGQQLLIPHSVLG